MFALYVQDAIRQSRYDFHMGRKIPAIVEGLGLKVVQQFTVPDAELSFSGRADPDVREAWEHRFDRMQLLQSFFGADFRSARDEFIKCLEQDDHYCSATVQCCIAIKADPNLTSLSV